MLIYLLTKPIDVSRWYVKQVLRIREKNEKFKITVPLLYLFKTYRPDYVPENIPVYAIQSIFKIPTRIQQSFGKAEERNLTANALPQSVDDIKWNIFDIKKRVNDVILVPKNPVVENDLGINSTNYKSLISVSK